MGSKIGGKSTNGERGRRVGRGSGGLVKRVLVISGSEISLVTSP